MIELACEFDSVRYPFYLGTDRHDALVETLRALEADRYFVIAHASMFDLGAGALARDIERFAPASVLFHPEGEIGKRLSAVEDLSRRRSDSVRRDARASSRSAAASPRTWRAWLRR
jgi:hypothetical protein